MELRKFTENVPEHTNCFPAAVVIQNVLVRFVEHTDDGENALSNFRNKGSHRRTFLQLDQI